MKLQYLGTAASEGWPALFCNCPYCQEARRRGGRDIRTRSQAIIDDQLLLDFPADSYYHILRENLDLSGVRWLLFTHSHSDHFYPEDLVMRGGVYAHNMTSPSLEVYGNEVVCDRLLKALGEEPKEETVHVHRVTPFEPFQAGPYTVTPLPARHMQTEQALFYLIEKDGKAILYAHDTGVFYPEVFEYFEKNKIHLDLVSLDGTMGKLSDFGGHMGVDDDIAMKNRLVSLGLADSKTQFIANHFSHNGGLLYDELVDAYYEDGLRPSYDGMVVTI